MKKNTGITLIALIITIIVMLILVAVSVNVLIKSNLIGTAEKAVDKYKTASEEEANGGTIEINGKKYASIEDYIEGKEAITEVHNWERTGDNLTCKHCNRTVTIGQELDYKDNGKGTSSIGEAESGIATAKANGEGWWASSYGEQTINKDANTKWVVLGAEDVNKNGTNETLLLTTKEPTTEKITLYGAAAYNNCIKEINRMRKEIYGTNARGITIEDVNRVLGYTPTENLTTKLKDLGEEWTAIKYHNTNNESGVFYDPSHPEGIADNGATLGEYELNGYYYEIGGISTNISSTAKAMIFGNENDNYHYWLASRGVSAISYYANFGPGSVSGGSASSYYGLFVSFGRSGNVGLPLRAVVSLRSDIPAVVE